MLNMEIELIAERSIKMLKQPKFASIFCNLINRMKHMAFSILGSKLLELFLQFFLASKLS